VPRSVGGAHVERVAAFPEGGGDGVWAGAGGPAAAVDAAFEARAGFGGAEAEARGGVVRGVGRARVDRRVRCSEVDGPGVSGGGGARVARGVGRAVVEVVGARAEGGEAVWAGARVPAAAVDAA